tara:strand:+ start:106 stop:807 length:702 start_codon:yes stop_codon:yes gene_type:complete
MEINNSIEDIDINFLCSKNEVLKKWLRNFPLSVRTNVKNILSIDSENPELDLEISDFFKNCKKYYIVQSDYDYYKESVEKLFGKFNFKVSYCDILDYELDPNIEYDLIIFYTNFDFDEDITSFIETVFKFLSKDGQILIITCTNDKFVLEAREYFDLKFISDKEIKEKILFDGRIFNTHISTFLNINKLNKKEMLKLTNKDISDSKIDEFKKYAIKKYGDYVNVPISILIIKK